MNTRKVLSVLAGSVALMGLALATPALADDNASGSQKVDHQGPKVELRGKIDSRDNSHFNMDPVNKMTPIISGVVSNINENTFTVSIARKVRETGDSWNHATTSASSTIATTTYVLYTIDATNAQVWKGGATTTLASVVNGDTVYVRGHLTSTSTLTATVITDGARTIQKEQPKKNDVGFQGNGEPVIFGTVSAISSSTLTVTSNASTTYTVDVSNAAIVSGNSSSTLSNIKVGDNVLVQGAVNGSSIVATSVVDQNKPAAKKITEKVFDSVKSFFS